jgi:hypothetical protein
MKYRNKPWYDEAFVKVLGIDPRIPDGSIAFFTEVQNRMKLPEYYIWEKKFRCEGTEQAEVRCKKLLRQDLKLLVITLGILCMMSVSSYYALTLWILWLKSRGLH